MPVLTSKLMWFGLGAESCTRNVAVLMPPLPSTSVASLIEIEGAVGVSSVWVSC